MHINVDISTHTTVCVQEGVYIYLSTHHTRDAVAKISAKTRQKIERRQVNEKRSTVEVYNIL